MSESPNKILATIKVQNDYAGLNAGTHGLSVLDFPARRASAYQAYYEHMPLRSSVLIDGVNGLMKGAEMRIYGDFQYGKLANICILDDRQYRRALHLVEGQRSLIQKLVQSLTGQIELF